MRRCVFTACLRGRPYYRAALRKEFIGLVNRSLGFRTRTYTRALISCVKYRSSSYTYKYVYIKQNNNEAEKKTRVTRGMIVRCPLKLFAHRPIFHQPPSCPSDDRKKKTLDWSQSGITERHAHAAIKAHPTVDASASHHNGRGSPRQNCAVAWPCEKCTHNAAPPPKIDIARDRAIYIYLYRCIRTRKCEGLLLAGSGDAVQAGYMTPETEEKIDWSRASRRRGNYEGHRCTSRGYIEAAGLGDRSGCICG